MSGHEGGLQGPEHGDPQLGMGLALSVHEGKAPQDSACVPGRNGLHRLQVVAQAVPGLLGSKVELCPQNLGLWP